MAPSPRVRAGSRYPRPTLSIGSRSRRRTARLRLLSNHLQEALAERLGLPLAHAFDVQQCVACARLEAGHVAQRGITEDEIRRHAALLGDRASERTERFEEHAVVNAGITGKPLGPVAFTGRGAARDARHRVALAE